MTKRDRGDEPAAGAIGLRVTEGCVSHVAMSTVAEIEAAISRLPLQQAEEVNEWLEQWLEDQRELSPEFVASIERGKADLAAGRSRVVRP